ncbi:35833_t:CDS:1, partial [Racocetra persica]
TFKAQRIKRKKRKSPPKKHHIIWKRPAINCEARIRITWLVASNMVRIKK